ncbi:hypothetical protein R8P03_004607 [Salmonella enterica]|uniref:Uncharacterized protein n=1 Tax=Enterobacter cloacae TaxID=550 RepID=A0A2S1LYY3_ENTCL|nr:MULTISPECIES: hypothetical protein [Enterobacteriaceae]EAO4330355.1 hypothetical protein [Salmonella enterica]ECD5592847.1 hypothetical protein [Salmonella enterica subsp. enterica serovar Typhimurium]ECG6671066.1 hypothetical protein [Salmonella enterica subsp. enterica serovar Weltevreden]ECW5176813.1 hypothetical protein [Salmonella enterica subsp. enterica serovar Enteritidis]EDF3626228.1 hypothetical protein [Salmonella enterica subsp. enterica serovar Newport]EGI5202440.1 hypothetica
MDDLRDFFSDALIGSFDDFIKSYPKFGWDNLSLLDDWNAQQIRPLLNLYHKQNGIELACDRRIFVVAPNPKPTGYPVRVTHYFEHLGALCDAEADSPEQAIIDCLTSYPDCQPAFGKLDSWMGDTMFANSFR